MLIDENGAKVGVVPIEEAQRMADDRQLDIVEVAPQAKPPVCRILDYGKYRYQLQKKDKDARKKQKVQTLKEIKMRPKIDEHDYNFKVRAVRDFLEAGHRVKVSVFFRGREMAHIDSTKHILEDFAEKLSDIAVIEKAPKMEGRSMMMFLTEKR